MQFKTIESKPRLGALCHQFPEPWKVSAMAEIGKDLVVMAYDNVSRHNSQIWLGSGYKAYSDDKAETLGRPMVVGDFIVTAGECGYLVYSHKGGIPVRHIKLGWATTCNIFNGQAVVIDRPDNDADNVIVRDCLTGATVFSMPGAYIALDSAVWAGKLWAAIGWDQGLSCSDGNMRRLPMCSCVVNHRDRLFVSSRNRIYIMESGNLVQVAELPCEKIMHMVSVGDDMMIAGAKPDTAWQVDSQWGLHTLGTVEDGRVDEVGGVCFGWQISRNYYVRTRKGSKKVNGRQTDCAEVYPIIW